MSRTAGGKVDYPCASRQRYRWYAASHFRRAVLSGGRVQGDPCAAPSNGGIDGRSHGCRGRRHGVGRPLGRRSLALTVFLGGRGSPERVMGQAVGKGTSRPIGVSRLGRSASRRAARRFGGVDRPGERGRSPPPVPLFAAVRPPPAGVSGASALDRVVRPDRRPVVPPPTCSGRAGTGSSAAGIRRRGAGEIFGQPSDTGLITS